MKPKFIEPMECLAVPKLPNGPQWFYEIKLDGYRAEAIRAADGVAFYSRNAKGSGTTAAVTVVFRKRLSNLVHDHRG
jgi:ATP-dependent DNA ligase